MVFSHARAFAPCVLVLEDLDSLITDQNRAFFLNEVDGLEDNDGLLLVSLASVDPGRQELINRSARPTTLTASTQLSLAGRPDSTASSVSPLEL